MRLVLTIFATLSLNAALVLLLATSSDLPAIPKTQTNKKEFLLKDIELKKNTLAPSSKKVALNFSNTIRTRPKPLPEMLEFRSPLLKNNDFSFNAEIADDSQNIGQDIAYREDGVDERAEVIQRGQARYPPSAREQGLEGHVLLRMRVSKEGRVEQVAILESSPSGVFDQVSIDAAQGYRFSPAKRRGEAVAVFVRLPLEYSL